MSFKKGNKINLGRKHTDKTKKKLRDFNLGKKLSEQTKEKMRQRLDEKSAHWKGGVSKQPFYYRDIARDLRNSAIEILGGKCLKCGFKDKRVLQIDHINGGGHQERKVLSGGTFHRVVIQSVLKKENKYQLLCANCNWIKRFEMSEHKKLSTASCLQRKKSL